MICPVCKADTKDGARQCGYDGGPLEAAAGFCPFFGTRLVADPAQASLIGQTLGDRYLVTDKLGQGTVGTVYRATDQRSGQAVALKVLNPEFGPDAPPTRAAIADSLAATRLGHPNLVPTLDSGHHQDRFAYGIEPLLTENALAARLESGPMPAAEAVRIAQDVAAGLEALHGVGVLHLAVKPDNIFSIRDPLGMERAVLTGIGLRHLLHLDQAPARTDGECLAQAEYLAPEIVGGKPLDERTDIYQMGLLLYEMLTGRPPFTGGTFKTVSRRHALEKPIGPQLVRPEARMGDPLGAVVMRCLEKAPTRRYADVKALRAALEAVARDGLSGSESASRYPAATLPPRTASGPLPSLTSSGQLPRIAAAPAEPKPAEPKPAEPKPAEPKPAEPKPAEPKPAEPKPAEPKPAEPKPAEPKPAEPKPAEPKPAEPKPAEPKPAEPKPAEPKPAEPKPAEPKPQLLIARVEDVAPDGGVDPGATAVDLPSMREALAASGAHPAASEAGMADATRPDGLPAPVVDAVAATLPTPAVAGETDPGAAPEALAPEVTAADAHEGADEEEASHEAHDLPAATGGGDARGAGPGAGGKKGKKGKKGKEAAKRGRTSDLPVIAEASAPAKAAGPAAGSGTPAAVSATAVTATAPFAAATNLAKGTGAAAASSEAAAAATSAPSLSKSTPAATAGTAPAAKASPSNASGDGGATSEVEDDTWFVDTPDQLEAHQAKLSVYQIEDEKERSLFPYVLGGVAVLVIGLLVLFLTQGKGADPAAKGKEPKTVASKDAKATTTPASTAPRPDAAPPPPDAAAPPDAEPDAGEVADGGSTDAGTAAVIAAPDAAAPAPADASATAQAEVSAAAEKLAAEAAAAQKLAAEAAAAEKLAAEAAAAEKLAAEAAAAEKLAAEKLAAEKLAAEKLAAEKLAAESTAAERLAADKAAADKAAADQAAADKAAADKAAADQAAADKAAADQAAAALQAAAAERDAAARQAAADQAAADKAAAKAAAAEKAAADKAAKAEKAAAAKAAAAEKAAAAKAAAAKAAAEKAAAAKAAGPDKAAVQASLSEGQSALTRADWQGAERAFRAVIALDRNNATAHAGLGKAAFEQQKFAESVNHRKNSVRLAPRNATYLLDLGMAYFKLDNYDEARKAWDKVLKVAPGNATATKYLGVLDRKQGRN